MGQEEDSQGSHYNNITIIIALKYSNPHLHTVCSKYIYDSINGRLKWMKSSHFVDEETELQK